MKHLYLGSSISRERRSKTFLEKTIQHLSKEVYGCLALLAIIVTNTGFFLLIFGLKQVLIFDIVSFEVLVASGTFLILFGGTLLCLSIVVYQRERRKKNICCWCCRDNEEEVIYGVNDMYMCSVDDNVLGSHVSLAGSIEMTTSKGSRSTNYNLAR
jgi:hypothetical protein